MDFFKKNFWCLLGMFLGMFSVAVGIYIFANWETYGSLSSYTFGADFYTEIYYATRTAANRIGYLIELLRYVFGWLFIIMGSINICYFGMKLKPVKKENNSTINMNMPQEALVVEE